MNKNFIIGLVVVALVLGGLGYMATKKQSTNSPASLVAKQNDVVSINYSLRLEDGTLVDSNIDPTFGHVEPWVIPLGANSVVQGLDEGVVGMRVGEKKTLTVPPEKGYGVNAVGQIPPNATLIYEVELLEINPAQ